MHAQSLIHAVPPANPETDTRVHRECAEQPASAQALREDMKQSVTKYGHQSREVAQKLDEIKQTRAYLQWGYPKMGHYVEGDLEMPWAKARKLLNMARTYKDSWSEVEDVGWSVLVEACAIANMVNVETAIAVAHAGRQAVRQWKQDHAATIEQAPSWKTFKLRMPPDVFETLEEALLLAEENGRAQGGSFPPDGDRWQPFHGVLIAALETLRAEREAHAQ